MKSFKEFTKHDKDCDCSKCEAKLRKENIEIDEGMTMKDFKSNRRKLRARAASADARKRGHEGREWHNSGRTYSADEAKSRRAKMSDDDRAARHRAAVDPDDDRDENTYSADKTKNPKKQRKQAAMGESLSFSQFVESRRMDREGVDRNDTARKNRTMAAKASVAAVQKRQAALDKHEKKTGTKLDISRSREGKEHSKNFPGSRQDPKERGAKETSIDLSQVTPKADYSFEASDSDTLRNRANEYEKTESDKDNVKSPSWIRGYITGDRAVAGVRKGAPVTLSELLERKIITSEEAEAYRRAYPNG